MVEITKRSLLRCIEEDKNDILLNLLVKPGSKVTQINGINEWRNALEISVRVIAEKGKANREVISLLSEILNCPLGDITIVKGGKSRNKIVRISGLSSEELLMRIRLYNA